MKCKRSPTAKTVIYTHFYIDKIEKRLTPLINHRLLPSLQTLSLSEGNSPQGVFARSFNTSSCVSQVPISQLNLEPQWVTGFIDAEGCFHVSFIKSKTSKLHWGISLEFKISLHEKDINLLKKKFKVTLVSVKYISTEKLPYNLELDL